MARSKFAARVAVGVAVLAALAGCTGGGADPKADDPTTPQSSAATSETPSESPSESPSETPSPAATGPLLKQPSAELNVPEGWHLLDQVAPVIVSGAKGVSSVLLGEVESFAESSNDDLAEIALRILPNGDDLVRKPDIDLAGRQVYRLVSRPGAASGPSYYEELGTRYHDQTITVTFDLDRRTPKAERQQIRDEVLASFVWK